ncbi:nuclease-related domain-containing protein [Lysinibacillus sp. 1P01SD]|uniref:nuclease-related domain-containing protein n=1 Tax=Lysinibacillus sp. 1P01SD TaxID=3132285 RepID=UPI0039A0E915
MTSNITLIVIFTILALLFSPWYYQQKKYRKSKIDFENSNTYKMGSLGEDKIKKVFKTAFKYDDVYILKNLYLPKLLRGKALRYSDELTEIDMVVIHHTGIYIIESKNYEGLIIGDSKLIYWQVHHQGFTKWLYNPLWQHGTHIRAIRGQIDLDSYPFYSLIIFGEDAILSDIKYEASKNNFQVLHIAELKEFLNSKQKRSSFNKSLLSRNEMKMIYKELKRHTRISNKQIYIHSQAVLAKSKKKQLTSKK